MWRWLRAPTSGHLTASIGEGSEVDGRCRLVGVAIVAGRVTGDFLTADELIVAESGCITATVRAAVIVVRGAITGNVVATERVELTATAHVVGDVETPALTMADGAVLDGHCHITRVRDDAPGDPIAAVAR